MTSQAIYPKGYYISGWGFGGVHGPLRDSSVRLDIVYGYPKTGFDSFGGVEKVEAAYELLRYEDPEKRSHIYIVRYDPANIAWGVDSHARAVPATPELTSVFTKLYPLFRKEHTRYMHENRAAFETAMLRLGLTSADEPAWREHLPEEEEKQQAREWNEFCQKVISHGTPARPITVQVEGLDAFFASIPVMALPERPLRAK